MSWKMHLPLVKVACAAMLSYALALAVHRGRGHEVAVSVGAACFFVAGGLYTHLVEYFYHKLAMHRTIHLGAFRFIDRRHLEHHRLFAGEDFQTRNGRNLREVTTQWYTFPVLFLIHYAVFWALFPPRYGAAFFLGVVGQFLFFEVSHWLTHVEDNVVDRMIAGIPLLSRIRAAQVEHHRLHHQRPLVNYNFTPPYLGDRLGRTRVK